MADPRRAQAGRVRNIELFYNATRRHSTLGYLSPAQFETNSITNNPKING